MTTHFLKIITKYYDLQDNMFPSKNTSIIKHIIFVYKTIK